MVGDYSTNKILAIQLEERRLVTSRDKYICILEPWQLIHWGKDPLSQTHSVDG